MSPQQGQNPEAWQQPPVAPSEYHPVSPVSPAPSVPVAPVAPVQMPVAPTPTGLVIAPVAIPPAPQMAPAMPVAPAATPQPPTAPVTDAVTTETAPADPAADDDYLHWQAEEGVNRERPPLWYVILAVVVLVLIALAIFVVHSITFAILVPVMALALLVYTRRPPRLVNYTLEGNNVHVADRVVTFTTFRAFSVVQHEGVNMIDLIPKKRFSLAEVLYFPEEIGEVLVDAVAARLPMREAKPDWLDRVVAKLRL